MEYILKKNYPEAELKEYINKYGVNNLDEHFVNIVRDGDILGTRLSINFGYKFRTFIGTVGSMRKAMDYIVNDDYPRELLKKLTLTKKEINSIPNSRKHVTNYVAAIALLLADRLLSDKKLIELLKDNSKILTSYTFVKTTSIIGDGDICVYNRRLHNYISILRVYEVMIKNDDFDKEHIVKFVNDCKVDKDKEITM